MDKLPHAPADTLHQADEEILTYTVSDEALEAAAGSVVVSTKDCGGTVLCSNAGSCSTQPSCCW